MYGQPLNGELKFGQEKMLDMAVQGRRRLGTTEVDHRWWSGGHRGHSSLRGGSNFSSGSN